MGESDRRMMLTLTTEFELAFPEDVYIGRIRGSNPEFMLNSGYLGIQTFTIGEGRIAQRIAFPESIPAFAIESWLVSPDGSRSYLFGRERGGIGLEVEHGRGSVRVLSLPGSFEAPTGLCWFTPGLVMRDYHGRHWELRNEVIEESPSTLVPEDLRIRLHLDNESAALGVLRMSYDRGGMYVMNGSRIGFVSLADEIPLLAPHNNTFGDVALAPDPDRLFLCSKEGITLWQHGSADLVSPVPAGERFLSIESVSFQEKHYLLAISAKEDGSGSMLRGYRLYPSGRSH